MGTGSVWVFFSARVIVDSSALVSRSVWVMFMARVSLGFPSLALLLLCRDNGGLESARVRARVRSAVASADCGMGSRALKARASAGSLANRRASKSKPRAAPKTCADVLSAAGADVEEGGAPSVRLIATRK